MLASDMPYGDGTRMRDNSLTHSTGSTRAPQTAGARKCRMVTAMTSLHAGAMLTQQNDYDACQATCRWHTVVDGQAVVPWLVLCGVSDHGQGGVVAPRVGDPVLHE